MTDSASLRALQWSRLREVLQRLQASCGMNALKLSAAGVDPAQITSLADFVTRVPLTSKKEILTDHLASPPFGTLGTESLPNYKHFCQTSGTSSGQPMAWVDTDESWSAMLDCWQRVFQAADLVPGQDRVFFAFSFGPFLGFWTAFEAAKRDFMAIPGGGLSSQARLEVMARYSATTLCCTPTYALRLGECIGQLSGVHLQDLSIQKIIVAGEPGGGIPEVRARIEHLWQARVYDHHGMTEIGPVSYETTDQPGHLHVIEEAYFAEVLDPLTGQEVQDGECGELVLTNLTRTACPLLRYRTGDWVRKRLLQGRLVLEGGILCRIDDMIVIRGVNLYPSAIEAVVRKFPEVQEFMVQQRQVDSMDEIEVLVEIAAENAAAVLKKLESRLRDTFSLRIPVCLVPAASLPRHEFKAKRWRLAAC